MWVSLLCDGIVFMVATNACSPRSPSNFNAPDHDPIFQAIATPVPMPDSKEKILGFAETEDRRALPKATVITNMRRANGWRPTSLS